MESTDWPEDGVAKPDGFWSYYCLELEGALRNIVNDKMELTQDIKSLKFLGQLSAFGYDRSGIRGTIAMLQRLERSL